MTQYVLSPLVKISRLDGDGRPVLRAGSGDKRSHVALQGSAAQPLIEWLLANRSPADRQEQVDRLSNTGLGAADAAELVDQMIVNRMLVPTAEASAQRDQVELWGRFGWRDAADFHRATFGLRFVPDETDGITYADYFERMMADEEFAGAQPAVHDPRAGTRLSIPSADDAAHPSLDEVLSNAMPINRFEGKPARAGEILTGLRTGFGVQRTVDGLLGPHQLRAYPSGGARHPFELYLVSRGLDDLPTGVYQFDAVAGELVAVREHGDAADIDDACFGKGGIRSASAVGVLTCRWLRHSWKYRYARSYRMLMLEAGHIVQSVTLALLRLGVQVYHCPAVDDTRIGAILGLDDDCAEGPVYALGLGHGGVR